MNIYLTLRIKKEFLSLKSEEKKYEKQEHAVRHFMLTFATKTSENFIRDQNWDCKPLAKSIRLDYIKIQTIKDK